MTHEKLHCYQQLLTLAQELALLSRNWSNRYAYLEDQFKRAISSAILNLAEGNGKRAFPKERRRFFQIAMGSIAETGACIDLAITFNLVSQERGTIMKESLAKSYCQIRKLP